MSIVIPVFNEETAIADDLRAIQQTMEQYGSPFEIIVVDDGSTDRSREIVSLLSNVRLVKHPYNRGTGAALMTGIRAARGSLIVMTDGDGTYPNHEIPRLLQCLDEYEMVVGARTSEQGTFKWLRVPAKEFIRRLASYMTGVNIPDLNSGLRAFHKDQVVHFFPLLPFGHSWVSTITMAYLSSGYTVKYVPIEYYRRKGRSTFHPIADTYAYLMLVVRVIMYFNPLKVFLPITLLMGVTGILKLVYDIFAYQFHIAPSTLLLLLASINLAAIAMLADLIVRRGMPLGANRSAPQDHSQPQR